MKKRPPFLVVLLLLWILSIPAKALEEVVVWKAEKIESAGGRMTWPDLKGTHVLELSNTQGVTIGEKPAVGSDEKSAVFSGQQQAAFTSPQPLAEFSGKIKVQLALKPGDATAGTILRFGRQWQISFKGIGQKTYLELALWAQSGAMTFARVELKREQWQEVVVSITENLATVSCNGQEESKPLSEPLRASPATILIGLPVVAVGQSQSSASQITPFQGAIADIHVSL